MPLRILVAERDDVIRQVIAALVTQQGWEVCAEAASGAETVAKASTLKPDVVLLDAAIANPACLDTTRQIVQQNPAQKLVILAATDSESAAREAFEAGALGYVVKANATRHLVTAIKAMQDNRTFFTPRIAENILHSYLGIGEPDHAKLALRSERERVAVKLLAREAATTLQTPVGRNPGSMPRAVKYLIILIVVGVSVWLVWSNYHDYLEDNLPFLDRALQRTGLKPATPPEFAGNPNAKVWIDLQTALYYCSGAPLYAKTPKGRFAKQKDALDNNFEPAGRKACQ
jgi:DNA-binding NarL/FixJ family response regulator